MHLIYQGVDISGDVDICSCVHRDVSTGRCDHLEIDFEHSDAWYGWKPEKNDVIEVEHEGYSTGKLYLNTILPENGRYLAIATSLPCPTSQRAWLSYHDMTLGDIMRACAAQCGMEWALYGIDAGAKYRYIERQNESCTAFLERILRMEGAVLKCINGRMAGIGIEYAQGLPAGQSIELTSMQDALVYRKMHGEKYSGITVLTPFARASAQDSNAAGCAQVSLSELPATDDIQAGRWARGLLAAHNRQAEQISLTTELNIGMTAMARIDITGGTDMDGEWLVDEAEHDFINMKTKARLLRCITTIK